MVSETDKLYNVFACIHLVWLVASLSVCVAAVFRLYVFRASTPLDVSVSAVTC